MRQSEPRELRYDGVHCNLALRQLVPGVIVLKISGTDIGEFGNEPMSVLSTWVAGENLVELFIDAREVQGASIDVSGEWAQWLAKNSGRFRAVTMLTGSRFIQVTAEFVRRFADLKGVMKISSDPAAFESALAMALDAQ